MDAFTIIMLAVLALLIFFMFRNSRKRQNEARELQSKVQPGAEVMTNFGVYGTILSIDEDENKVLLETAPGNVLTVHRQVVARVVEPPVADDAETGDAEAGVDDDGPAFGERVDDAADAQADAKKSDD